MTDSHAFVPAEEGERKTPCDCHACGKGFVALIDYSQSGKLIIECPRCGHEHLRVVQGGRVTEERWGSAPVNKDEIHRPRRYWKHDTLPARSTTAANFLRERWYDKLE